MILQKLVIELNFKTQHHERDLEMPKPTNQQRSPQALRPHTRRNKLQTRANNEQLQALLTKAHLYFDGNMAELLLQGALAYRPIRKDQGRKA